MSHPKGKGEPGITDVQEEFTVFVNDKDEGRECTLSRFAGDTKLSGAGCTLRDLDRPKWWPVGTSGGLTRPSADAAPGQPLESIQAWNEQMEELWEKDLGVLVDGGDMTQPRTSCPGLIP